MAILNYTTTIDYWKTINEIQKIISKHGASQFSIINENNIPVSMTFTIEYEAIPLTFKLPCNYTGILKVLKKGKISNSLKTDEQAVRVGWRIIKNWIEAQLALVQSEVASIHQVFMPYLLSTKYNKTLYETFEEKGLKFLS